MAVWFLAFFVLSQLFAAFQPRLILPCPGRQKHAKENKIAHGLHTADFREIVKRAPIKPGALFAYVRFFIRCINTTNCSLVTKPLYCLLPFASPLISPVSSAHSRAPADQSDGSCFASWAR